MVIHKVTMCPYNPTPKDRPKRNENIPYRICALMFIAAVFLIAER